MENYYICPFRYHLVLCIKKFTKNALTLTTQKSSVGVSLSLSNTHTGLPWGHPRHFDMGSTNTPPPPPPRHFYLGTIFDSSNYSFGCSNKIYFNLTFEAQRSISMKILLVISILQNRLIRRIKDMITDNAILLILQQMVSTTSGAD